MYDDYEGPINFYYVFVGAAIIATIVFLIFFIAKVYDRIKEITKERTKRPSLIDALKFIWMLGGVAFFIFFISFFFPDFSIDKSNERIMDFIGIDRALGVIVDIVFLGTASILAGAGIHAYFGKQKPNKEEVK